MEESSADDVSVSESESVAEEPLIKLAVPSMPRVPSLPSLPLLPSLPTVQLPRLLDVVLVLFMLALVLQWLSHAGVFAGIKRSAARLW